MDKAAFEAAWAEGQALSQEQAITEALRIAAELDATETHAGSGPPISVPSSPA
jgi:hypothetical protein